MYRNSDSRGRLKFPGILKILCQNLARKTENDCPKQKIFNAKILSQVVAGLRNPRRWQNNTAGSHYPLQAGGLKKQVLAELGAGITCWDKHKTGPTGWTEAPSR